MVTTPNGRWSPDGTDGIDDLLANLAQMQATNESADNVTRGMITSPTVASQAARNLVYPSPVQGNRVFRADMGWEEAYFEAYNVNTNPGGATPAGWYPISGAMPKYAVWRNISSTLAAGNWVDWQWVSSTVLENRGNGFTVTTANPTEIRVPYRGWYDVTYQQSWSNGRVNDNERFLRITTDGMAPFNLFNDIDRADIHALGQSTTLVLTARVHASSVIRTGSWHNDGPNLQGVNPQVFVSYVSPSL